MQPMAFAFCGSGVMGDGYAYTGRGFFPDN